MHELFKKRRSVRQFLDKPVEHEKIHQVLCAAQVAPSGNGLKGWEFIVVTRKETLAKLGGSGGYQAFLKDVPVGIVIICEEKKSWIENCSIAAAHIYLEAVNQGLLACWANVINGTTEDGENREEFVKKILGISEKYRVLCVMALGYPANIPSDHSEDEYNDDIVHSEKF